MLTRQHPQEQLEELQHPQVQLEQPQLQVLVVLLLEELELLLLLDWQELQVQEDATVELEQEQHMVCSSLSQ